MTRLEPNTRLRCSLVELDELELAGGPSAATVNYASDGSSEPWSGGKVALKSCPDLLTVEWELSGVKVSAQLDVVASSYCAVEDIKGYRSDVYENDVLVDETVIAARSRAIETIEREAGRFLQPVMRVGVVDRPNCSNMSVPFVDGRMATDIITPVRATGQDGSNLTVRKATEVSLDVIGVPVGEFAEVALVMGLNPTPSEMMDAVVALASYFLAPKAGPENASSMSTEAGVVNYVLAGVGGAATSLPEVNAVISRYGVKRLLVG